MTKNFRPSMTERSIGRVLRKWRNDAGMTLAEACVEAGFSVATLSLNKNAIKPFDPLDIMILGRVYKLPNEICKQEVRRAELAARERTQTKGKQSVHKLNAAKDVDESYVEATTIRAFGSDLIPRLAQTPEYRIAATALGCPTYPGDDPTLKSKLQADWIKSLASNETSGVIADLVVTKRAIH